MDQESLIKDLAELSGGPLLTNEEGLIAVRVEAVFGHPEQPIDEAILCVKLKRCYVQLRLSGAEISLGSRYSTKLQEHSVERVLTDALTTDSAKGSNFESSGRVKISAWIPTFTGELVGKVSGGSRAASARSRNTTRKPEINLVSALPNGRWLIGDPQEGDIRRTDGCLFGPYLTEASSAGMNEQPPLCLVRPAAAGSKPLGVQLSLVARTTDFEFRLRSRWGSDEREPSSGDRQQFESGLKAAVAGIVICDALKKDKKEIEQTLQSNEILVSIMSLDDGDILRINSTI